MRLKTKANIQRHTLTTILAEQNRRLLPGGFASSGRPTLPSFISRNYESIPRHVWVAE